MKGQAKQRIQHYEHWLAYFHNMSKNHADPELREAANVIADAYGYLIMWAEKRI
jgi:hypothetical protein